MSLEIFHPRVIYNKQREKSNEMAKKFVPDP